MTSLTNLDYFEFVAGIPNIKDGYTPATCIRPESFFHCHYRNINVYFRRTQELIKKLSTPPQESKSTEIGMAVNGLRKHGSDKTRQLAKTLIGEWKELVNQWVYTTKEIAGGQGTPESALCCL